jgi:hypothetical protein
MVEKTWKPQDEDKEAERLEQDRQRLKVNISSVAV